MGQRGRPPVFSEEFRRDAIELVQSSGRPVAQIADESGVRVNRETPRGRVRYAEKRDALAGVGVGVGQLPVHFRTR